MSEVETNFSGPVGDLPDAELRASLERAASMAADYLAGVGERTVLPGIEPGAVRAQLPAEPPRDGESMEAILDDYRDLIEPHLTHWNHPRFFSYFAITGSGPGVVAETLAAATNVNAMLWRTSPAAVELEMLVCDWLRGMLALPQEFVGHINDTASTSTLVALAAARHRAFPATRTEGWVGIARELSGLPVIYASEQAHSSVDKAALTIGIGTAGVRKVPCNERYEMDSEALSRAIEEDRQAGNHPFAVVATAGTTSTTSIDPIEAIADICERERLWLHVDAAYAGSAAICPEVRALMPGLERADSIVLNPHKWLFVPVDCSVLLTRGYDELREAFSLVAEYLRSDEDVVNLMDLGPQLGRRFRSLKLWMVIRSFGVEGLQRRIRFHLHLAQMAAQALERSRHFEVTAPVPFSTVCFRMRAAEDADGAADADALSRALVDRVNRSGRAFLAPTVLDGRVVIRWAIGNLRTEEADIEATLDQLEELAAELRNAGSAPGDDS